MLDPVGPLPPAVYWRRRAIAILAIVLSALLIFWVASTIANADDQPAGSAATSSSSSSPAASHASGTSSSDAASAATKEQSSEQSGAGSETTTVDSPPADVPPPATTTSAPPPTPTACAPESIQVQVSANGVTFTKGDKPKLVLSVVNVGAQPCYRDLNAATQELTVWDSAGTRLWSSNDCYPESSDDTRLLQPGQKVDFGVLWSGKVSEPTCTQPRPPLGPGQYYWLAVQDGIVSAPVTFEIT